MKILHKEQKEKIYKNILTINDKELLNDLQYIILENISKNKKEEIEEPKTFEEWNKQFIDNLDLDTFIPEYGTTLREFRRGIYDAEMSDDSEMSFDEFKESIKSW